MATDIAQPYGALVTAIPQTSMEIGIGIEKAARLEPIHGLSRCGMASTGLLSSTHAIILPLHKMKIRSLISFVGQLFLDSWIAILLFDSSSQPFSEDVPFRVITVFFSSNCFAGWVRLSCMPKHFGNMPSFYGSKGSKYIVTCMVSGPVRRHWRSILRNLRPWEC